MPATPASPHLPAHAAVVVIGGGVMGCSTLYHLAQSGVGDAVLLERHQLTAGTTWHSAAQVRALRSSYNLTALIRYSIDLYQRLEAQTGQCVGWVSSGSISLACTPDRLTHIQRQMALAQLFGVRAEAITPAQAKEQWQLMQNKDVLGAVWSPDDGRVNPSDLCAALASGAKAKGSKIFENTTVTGIVTQAGKVCGVHTDKGDIRCDAVAVCAGLWSREVAAMAGATAPLWPCEHFYLLTQPLAGVTRHLPTLSDHDSHLYIRDEGGGLLVGCFEPRGKAIPPARLQQLSQPFQLLPEDWAHFEPMMQNALARVPALENAQVKTLLNGAESFTPDGAFMLGEATETRGLFLGCGMNSVGVASGGGAGHALAHHIVHGHPPAALPEADPARFPPCFNSAAALSARVPEVLGRHYEISYPHIQPTTARGLLHPPATPLWQQHNAHFGQVYGWERPLFFAKTATPRPTFARPDWFTQVGQEVQQAHAGAAIFDISTLGKVRVQGHDAEQFLNRVCTADMSVPPGRVIYTAMLNSHGGIVADLTALRLSADHYHLYTGSAAVQRDMAHLQRCITADDDITLTDETTHQAMFALAGEQTPALATALAADDWNAIPRFHHATSTLNGVAVRVARLSYVGEAGWEISCPASDAIAVCTALLSAGATPAGLYAQTAMRIEKRHLAYGHDIDSDSTPIEAGLRLPAAKNNFIGKTALQHDDRRNGTHRRLLSLVAHADEPLMHGGEPVRYNGRLIGQVTSATYGYRLGKQVAIALLTLPAPLIPNGNNADNNPANTISGHAEVLVADKTLKADIIIGAAYDHAGERMKVK